MLIYLNAEYKDFPSIDNVLYDPSDPQSPIVNLKGNKLPFAPEFSAALAYEHEFVIGRVGFLIPRLQSQLQTPMYLDDFNRENGKQDMYTRTDISIRYLSESGWMFEIFVKNVEDSTVMSNFEIKGNSPGADGVAGNPGTPYAYLDPPRMFGARMAYSWSD